MNNPNQPYFFTDQNPRGSGGANLTVDNVWFSPSSAPLAGGVVFLMQNGLTGALWSSNYAGDFGLFLGNYAIYNTSSYASVPQVPLPPAGWLFLFAIVGLGFWGCRQVKRSSI